MNTLSRSVLAALVLASAAPGVAQAQSRFVNGMVVTNPESLTAQDKEMLALANEVGRRFVETMEKWLAAKEVSEEQLLSGLYYPIPNTDPPKFTSAWDKLSDRDILPIMESALTRSQTIDTVFMVDRNGYIATHVKKFSQPLTGNFAVDLVKNRTKRLFNDRVGLLAARNKQPFILQYYARDTGEVLATIAVPLYVRGQHYGAARISYRPAADAK